jgi:hypothetical protein
LADSLQIKMQSLVQVLAVFAVLTVSPLVNAYETCYRNDRTLYCSECCCDDSFDCCSCVDVSLAGWAIALIVIGVIVLIAAAVGVGVWRRRVYLARQQTVVTTSGVPQQMVTQYAY